jgi:hypothetical protein
VDFRLLSHFCVAFRYHAPLSRRVLAGFFTVPVCLYVRHPWLLLAELFPYHMDHTLYPVLASHVGVGNYPVHAINGSRIWSRDKNYFPYKCDNYPGISLSYKGGTCRLGEERGCRLSGCVFD